MSRGFTCWLSQFVKVVIWMVIHFCRSSDPPGPASESSLDKWRCMANKNSTITRDHRLDGKLWMLSTRVMSNGIYLLLCTRHNKNICPYSQNLNAQMFMTTNRTLVPARLDRFPSQADSEEARASLLHLALGESPLVRARLLGVRLFGRALHYLGGLKSRVAKHCREFFPDVFFELRKQWAEIAPARAPNCHRIDWQAHAGDHYRPIWPGYSLNNLPQMDDIPTTVRILEKCSWSATIDCLYISPIVIPCPFI